MINATEKKDFNLFVVPIGTCRAFTLTVLSGLFFPRLVMSLKKCLISSFHLSRRGQVVIEYFILFVLIAGFAIIASSSLFSRTRNSVEEFTNKAVNVMVPDIE